MRDEAPVYYNQKYDFYALTGYDDVSAAYKGTATYSSAHGASLDQVKSDDMNVRDLKLIILMDPPEHERMRKLVSRAFTPRAIAGLESMVRAQISQAIRALNPASFDAVADFILQTGAYYYELIQERRAHPQDDMISRLIEVEIDEGGASRTLDDIEIAGFASMLGAAGAETVTKLVGNAVVVFADYPDQWQLLQRDRTKIGAAVEELLRFEGPSQYNVRYTLREATLHDTTIPAGSAVLLINGSANRDERVFPDPDRFDIDRQRKLVYNIGFGYGIHSCLGAALAHLESRIALEMLLDFIPRFDIDRSGLRRVHMSNVAGWSNVPVCAR